MYQGWALHVYIHSRGGTPLKHPKAITAGIINEGPSMRMAQQTLDARWSGPTGCASKSKDSNLKWSAATQALLFFGYFTRSTMANIWWYLLYQSISDMRCIDYLLNYLLYQSLYLVLLISKYLSPWFITGRPSRLLNVEDPTAAAQHRSELLRGSARQGREIKMT